MQEAKATVSVTNKWLQMEVEQNFLEPYGVTWAAYHGGHLVRPSVKALMTNADDIFSSQHLCFHCDHVDWASQRL